MWTKAETGLIMTRIREVPGSNAGADQPAWGLFIKANAGLDFHYHDPFHHYSSNSYIIKLKSVNPLRGIFTLSWWSGLRA